MAINNKTFNNVINTLKQLGAEHDQIATTTSGDIFEIDFNLVFINFQILLLIFLFALKGHCEIMN